MLSGFRSFFLAILVFFFALPSVQAKDFYVVTTTTHLADLARQIAGDRVEVEALMGTGIDPHLYRPTRSDIVKLRKADLILYNGLHLEGQMVGLFQQLKEEKTVVSAADALPSDRLLQAADKAHDPHIWMDVSNWAKVANHIAKSLESLSPSDKDHFKANLKLYQDKLTALDTHIQKSVSSIPADKRILITAHDAFGYFGNAYGLDVLGIQGLSTESETSLKRMDDLAVLIAERQIPAIFTETSVNDRNIQALAENAENRGHIMRLGQTLYSDSLGPAGTNENNYIGMMLHNTAAITEGLGGKPAPFFF